MNPHSPMSHAQDRGAAKSGHDHWWAQRVSAIAMVPLSLWFFWSLSNLNITDHYAVADWFAEFANAILTLLLIANLCFHSYLGVQVVIEDYIRGPVKVTSLIASQFIHVVLAAIGLVAILKLALGD